MKAWRVLTVAVMLSGALCALGRLGVAADPSAFPISGADAVYEPALVENLPTDLGGSVEELPSGYLPPVSSDSTQWEVLAPVLPEVLTQLVEAIPLSHMSPIGSDSTLWRIFRAPPSVLGDLLDAIPQSLFPVQSSDGTYLRSMVYPKLLLNDTIPPQISRFSYDGITGLLEFVTDEFAVNEIWYGDAFDDYTHVYSTTTWAKTHQVILPHTNADYVKIRCADRSGNIYDFYSPGFTVFGSVGDEEGQPIADVVVSLDAFHITLTDDTGAYALGGIPDGSYTLSASHPDYAFEPVELSVSGDTEVRDVVGNRESNTVYLPLVIRNGS